MELKSSIFSLRSGRTKALAGLRWSMESKPSAAVGERIFKGERYDLGAAAPFSTTTSSLQGRVGGSTSTSKMIEHTGSGSTRLAVKLSPCIACTALPGPSVRSRVFLCAYMSVSMAGRGCRASHFRLAKRFFRPSHLIRKLVQLFLLLSETALLLFSAVYRSFLQIVDIRPPAWVDQVQILLAGGWGHCPQGQPRSSSVAC